VRSQRHPRARTLRQPGVSDHGLPRVLPGGWVYPACRGRAFRPRSIRRRRRYSRYQTNTTCAAGTGAFLDQQARRLNLSSAGELAAVALRSTGAPPKIATRCAVFAKTDLAHAQQEGFSLAQICDGLCQGVARHIVDALVGGQPVRAPIVFSGGVSRNRAVVEHLNRMLGTELICEKGPCGAAGAALCLLTKPTPAQVRRFDPWMRSLNRTPPQSYGLCTP